MARSYLSPEHFVQAAESLAPLIYTERAATERNRALSSDLFGAIRDAGLFSLWVPKDFGGPEIPIRDFMRVVEALARADASIGWGAANASTNSVLSPYLSGPIIREIWDNGPTVVAGALNSNRATAVVEPADIVSPAHGHSPAPTAPGCSEVAVCLKETSRRAVPDVRLMSPKSEAHVWIRGMSADCAAPAAMISADGTLCQTIDRWISSHPSPCIPVVYTISRLPRYLIAR